MVVGAARHGEAIPAGRVSVSDHLAALVAEARATSACLAAADPAAVQRVVAAARRDAARLSARLDGSPLSDATADEVDAGRLPVGLDDPPGHGRPAGGWPAALKLDGMATQDIAAVEYANLLACFDAEAALAAELFAAPLDVLGRLHGVICRGLVGAESVGRPRRSARAVHDGAQGRVLYDCPRPDRLPGLLEALGRWLRRDSRSLPAVVVAAVLAERLLEWQPFEAGNGRLGRAAARLVLRARDVDPWGVAVPERLLAADPGAYYEEVAATIHRRGDLGLWAEYHTEAVLAGLRAAATAAAAPPLPAPRPEAVALAAGLRAGDVVTVAEWSRRAQVNRQAAHDDLRRLASAGHLALVSRTRGLRYRRAEGGQARPDGQA